MTKRERRYWFVVALLSLVLLLMAGGSQLPVRGTLSVEEYHILADILQRESAAEGSKRCRATRPNGMPACLADWDSEHTQPHLADFRRRYYTANGENDEQRVDQGRTVEGRHSDAGM